MARLEAELRQRGRGILLRVMRQLVQSAVTTQPESARIGPKCGSRRHHQGVCRRKLLSSLGSLRV